MGFTKIALIKIKIFFFIIFFLLFPHTYFFLFSFFFSYSFSFFFNLFLSLHLNTFRVTILSLLSFPSVLFLSNSPFSFHFPAPWTSYFSTHSTSLKHSFLPFSFLFLDYFSFNLSFSLHSLSFFHLHTHNLLFVKTTI